ncbi:MAG: Ig-like domain-containing protein [Rikenellaceae bacterium]
MKKLSLLFSCAALALTLNSCEDNSKQTITIESISIGDAKVMTVGEELNLTVEVTPSELLSELTFTWSSSNDDVVTVDNTGLAKAVGAGFADLSVKCNEYPTFTSSCDVEVVLAYQDIAQSGGVYFGNMFVEEFDNYTYYLAEEGVVVSDVLGMSGEGISLMFDMYAPLNSGVDLPEGTYTAFDENLDDGTICNKFIPGTDYGDGFLQGSFVSIANGDGDDKYLITGGELVFEKDGDTYTVKADITDENGENYLFKYTGALNINDPFAGI